MIIIPNELKPILNMLIRYYRKHSDDPSYQSKNFILDENGIEICDISTLSKLENNRIQCMDDIYFELLKKMNYKFKYDEKANELIHQSNKKLLNYAEINDVPKILSVLKKVMNTLSTYQNYILYKEYLEIYNILYMYYDNHNFDKELLDKYIELYDLIEEELRAIFITIAYHYYSRVNIEIDKILHILNRSFKLKNETIIKHYLICIFYLRNNQLIELHKHSIKGTEKCKKDNNKYYLVRFYNLLAIIYRFDDSQKSIYYLTLCIAGFDRNNDSYETLTAFYHNIAQISYDREEYINILHIYFKHLYDDIQVLNVFFYLLIDTINKTTKDIDEIKRIIKIVDQNPINYAPFHSDILNLFKYIYVDYSFIGIIESAHSLIRCKNHFINAPLMKDIILNVIKDECIKNNQLQFYYDFVEKFQ